MNLVGGFQEQVYWNGLDGNPCRLPFGVQELEDAARAVMTVEGFGYVAGGAGSEGTVAANRSAFSRWALTPRVLRDGAARDLSCTLLSTPMTMPVLLGPLGVAEQAHPEAESAVARAAAEEGVVQVLSTVSSHALEDVAAAAPDGRRWFQLYWPDDEALARSLVARAEAAGYEAIVLTVDTFTLGWRPRDLAAGYFPFFAGKGLTNYFSDPAFRALLGQDPHAGPDALRKAVMTWGRIFNTPTFAPDDVARLKEWTDLPVVVKGVCHPGEADLLVAAGADAIGVSTHGGRQLENCLPALDLLPAVAAAVAGRVPVLFDSGIRTGADVFTAMALGADAVLLGRPWMYGLAVGGEAGVAHVLRCIRTDFENCLALTGHRTPASVSANDVTPAAPHHR